MGHSSMYYFGWLLLMTGVMLGLISTDGFGAWAGLELSMMGILPLLTFSAYQGAETALKYLLVQFTGSFMLIISCYESSQLEMICGSGILISLMLKSGCAPFHFWLPRVSEDLSWIMLGVVLVIQKVVPLKLLEDAVTEGNKEFILMIVLVSAIIGSLGGLGETNIKKILAYSSIGHLSWILLSVMMKGGLWVKYFLGYSFLVVGVLQAAVYAGVNSLKSYCKSSWPVLLLLMFMFSLGGAPPFFGFLPKLLVVLELSEGDLWLLPVLVITSTVTIFYYLRVCLLSMGAINSDTIKKSFQTGPSLKAFTFVNLFGSFFVLPAMSLLL